jgi:hypothetical protein
VSKFDSAWLHEYENKSRRPVPNPQPRECPAPLATDRGGETPRAGRPVVRFRLCRVKLLDVDAKYASVKDLLDGLTSAGLIHGDKEGQVRLEVEQEKVASYASERTLIEIEYPNE